jgi:membrane protease YdiL (CAAX protease family)
VADYGFHLSGKWLIDFAFGAFLGAAMLSGIFLAEWIAGWVTVSAAPVGESGVGPGPAVMASFAAFLAVAFVEEFTSRGYQLRNLAEGLVGRWIGPRSAIVAAWLISSSIFGFLHLGNPSATIVSSVTITLTAGGLLGLAYVLTGELAIPMGIHLTWNFFEGPVYGFPVSGTKTTSLLNLQQTGPVLWTGGDFGPEAGLLCAVAGLIACAILALWVKLRYGGLAFDAAVARYEPRTPVQQDQEVAAQNAMEPLNEQT